MKENIFYAILGITMIICAIVGVTVWCGIIYIGIKECYNVNPTSLWVVIPIVLIVHIFGYICFTRK
jgi:hypothetical protein